MGREWVLVLLATALSRSLAAKQFTYFQEEDNVAVESRQEPDLLDAADFNSDYSHLLPQAGFGERIGDEEEKISRAVKQEKVEDVSENRSLKFTPDFLAGLFNGKNNNREEEDDMLNSYFLSDLLSGGQSTNVKDDGSQSGMNEVEEVQAELSDLHIKLETGKIAQTTLQLHETDGHAGDDKEGGLDSDEQDDTLSMFKPDSEDGGGDEEDPQHHSEGSRAGILLARRRRARAAAPAGRVRRAGAEASRRCREARGHRAGPHAGLLDPRKRAEPAVEPTLEGRAAPAGPHRAGGVQSRGRPAPVRGGVWRRRAHAEAQIL